MLGNRGVKKINLLLSSVRVCYARLSQKRWGKFLKPVLSVKKGV
jgi:hypothetical protein